MSSPIDETSTKVVSGQSATEGQQMSSSVTLPKGGGAIRGIGEKFAANPVTGTGSMSVPIATSPGRAGFAPKLSLSYDSGAGNGIFGFGWSLSLPAITRKTEKGLPRYHDGLDSDVFILSGAEDLVAVLGPDGSPLDDTTTDPRYTIRRYRPRVDTLFARIERWTRRADGDVHWRSLSGDNILTIYGGSADSRIADPEDPARIFSWLICESRDDRGNAIVYGYTPDDGSGVDRSRACERNRSDASRATNRYPKRIRYGNRRPLLDDAGRRPRFLTDLPTTHTTDAGWMFEVVLDYGEHDDDTPAPDDSGAWLARDDAFSSYRAGFEVRTTRLCRRVLMFHHIPDSPDAAGYEGLVRSTDFEYAVPTTDDASAAGYGRLRSVTQTGYRRDGAGYRERSLPPVEFEYTEPVVQHTVQEVDPASLENLPTGVDGAMYQWVDLHGEGIPGVLTEQADAWFYKRNLSPTAAGAVALAPLERVEATPNQGLAGDRAQFMDLAGDGQPDLVVLDGPTPGLYEHDEGDSWQPFRPFTGRLNRDLRAPGVKLVDLDGDGHADVLMIEDDAFVWHPSLAEAGFGPPLAVAQSFDEEKGPRLVFADGTQSVYLADLSGDGLSDLARIRNGEVCYWPNLGYGRFGAKVTMDGVQPFDSPDQFDHRHLRLADIDGTGTTDLIYLHRHGVRLYFNQSGNSWSRPTQLAAFPRVNDAVSVTTADLLGNGTACLVWSSALPDDAGRPMRFVNLMGKDKPHLLVRSINNLGAETVVQYAPSTKFYLQDEAAGTPWYTHLPFPVHVVERVETYDRISRNRFVTRYAYHHGSFDGEEREFRGFGTVDQWDTEELGALTSTGVLPTVEGSADNEDAASHVPPVRTTTWFHTGAPSANHVPDGSLTAPPLPSGLTRQEEREAHRALKGSMLRQELYALDGSLKQEHPYGVSEHSFSVRLEQPRGGNAHAVFFAHPAEVVEHHHERNPDDARVQHSITLEVDQFGNVLKSAVIGYGRQQPPPLAHAADRGRQTTPLLTYTEDALTEAIDDVSAFPDDHRTPLPAESRTFELTGYRPTGSAIRFQASDFVAPDPQAPGRVRHVFEKEIGYEETPSGDRRRRPIDWLRTLHRRDDLSALLPLGRVQPRALPGESYRLAFTAGLLDQVFQRDGAALLPDQDAVLGGQAGDRGGYLPSAQLKADGLFPGTDPDGHWWVPAGRVFLSPGAGDTAEREHAYAIGHFFLAHRTRDPFHSAQVSTERFVAYDDHDLLTLETRDPLGNRVIAGNDYRVLQPRRLTDPNGNSTEVAFDALGLVVGTAITGKPGQEPGDSFADFEPDLSEDAILAHVTDPLAGADAILRGATTRVVYNLLAYRRTRDGPDPQPAAVATLARETHVADVPRGGKSAIRLSFSYSDGFGREIQQKLRAEPGPVVDGGPVVAPRWVASGWTVFNNKGKPVRRYEPFFTATPAFELGVKVGVSPVVFYDPVGRVVATLHPDHSYEKVLFDPWQGVTWDANDTVLDDPRTDPDIKGYVEAYFASLPTGPGEPEWKTWHAQRQGGGPEQDAAAKAAAHARTPTTVHLDVLGRAFLTIADNGPDPGQRDRHLLLTSRVELDIEGNQRAVRDAVIQADDPLGRIVMRYAYDLLGHTVHQRSMEGGARSTLHDVAGAPLRDWDERGHTFRTDYDPLRRPVRLFVLGADPADPGHELLTERLVYGEQHPDASLRNLRGVLHLHLDQAGAVSTEARDVKGNPLRVSRRLTAGTRYQQAMDWRSVDADLVALPVAATAPLDPVALEAALAPALEADAYTSLTTYDALNRRVTVTTPHTHAMRPTVIRPAYNDANLLERVDANLQGATANGEPVWSAFITNIDYDAKGQRRRIDFGNGTSTEREYDPLTLRLVHLATTRAAADFPGDDPQPPPADWPGRHVQNLHYTYDPVGNVTQIRDDAQQRIFFANRRVEPGTAYTYDPIYRLIEATGREHVGQSGTPIPDSADDALRSRLPHPGDGNAMGAYVERYVYDAVGNFLIMQHRGTTPASPGWTRNYEYAETSLLEDGTGGNVRKTSNRLSSTVLTDDDHPPAERYLHDADGNVTRMPHLSPDPGPNLHWDHHDQLQRTDRGGGGTAYYVYDADGQRVRKVWEKSAGLVEERIYLGDIEIYRRRQGGQRLERETLHVMADTQRIAVVETRTLDTAGNDGASAQVVRYQLGDHLGSASVELDDRARIISYEEYTPYGSTSYQAVSNQTETPKRYRYTGKERDEETGLAYHGKRYLAPWLGRWTSCDPQAIAGGDNLYRYAGCCPTRFVDRTGLAPKTPEELKAQVRDLYQTKLDLKEKIANAEQKLKRASDTAMNIRANVEASGKGSILHYFSEDQKFLRAADRDVDSVSKTLGSLTQDLAGVKRQLTTTEAALREHGLEHFAEALDIQGEHEAAAEIRRELIETTEDRFKRFAEEEAKKAGKGPKGGGGGGGGGGGAPPAAPHGGGGGGSTPAAPSGAGAAERLGPEVATGAKLGTEGEAAALKGAEALGLGAKLGKAAPFIGIGVGAFLVGGDLAERRYGRALVDAVEAIPIVGDVVLVGELAIEGSRAMAEQQAEHPDVPLALP
jgi:RHS repeat-associated protein